MSKEQRAAASLAKAPHLANWVKPAWMKFAIEELGEAEVAGKASSQPILNYRELSGLNLAGDDGVVPWCAIFVNAMLAKAGVETSGSAMARSFASSDNFIKLDAPILGCITVISSSRGPASGHVFFNTGQNGLFNQGLGGNQNDQVSIDQFSKWRNGELTLVGHYWPKNVLLPNAPYNISPMLRPIKKAKAVSDA